MSLWTPDGERPVSRTSPADVTAANPQGGTAGAGTPPPELRQALAEAGIDIDQLTPDHLVPHPLLSQGATP